MPVTACLIVGDGIGPEVTRAATDILDAVGAEIEWLPVPAGAGDEFGDVLPERTLEAIAEHRLALQGAEHADRQGLHEHQRATAQAL